MRPMRLACAGSLLVGIMSVCIAGGLRAQLTDDR